MIELKILRRPELEAIVRQEFPDLTDANARVYLTLTNALLDKHRVIIVQAPDRPTFHQFDATEAIELD